MDLLLYVMMLEIDVLGTFRRSTCMCHIEGSFVFEGQGRCAETDSNIRIVGDQVNVPRFGQLPEPHQVRVAWLAATYSASELDWDTVPCLRLTQ